MTDVIEQAPVPEAGTRSSALGRLLKNPMGVASIAFLALLVVVAVLAPVLATVDPGFADLSAVLVPPGSEHLLGTDSAGRDIFSRLVYGTQLTLLSGALAASVAVLIGVPAGLLAGYYGRFFDSLSSWVANVLLALPAMIVLLAVRSALGPSTWIAMTVFGVLLSPGYFRLTRAIVQGVRGELYVDAARVAGLSDLRIIGRHILTVVRAPIIIQSAGVAGVAISIQSSLEFLGLGDPNTATWGVMVNDGFRSIYRQPLNLLWPSLAIALTVAAFVLLGNAIRDSLEDVEKVTLKRRRRTAAAAPAAAVTQTATAPDGEPSSRGVLAVALDEGEPSPDELLRVRDLHLGYPRADGTIKTVVDGVSIHVDRNEVLGLVGESGSGKSQTAFAILGLLPSNAVVTGGSITFDGAPLVREGDHRVSDARLTKLRGRRIAYIPQEPMSNLDPSFTVGDQLARPMVKVLGLSRGEARRRALELLRSVGITDPERTAAAYPHEISGGMAQRVLIAGAISCEPDLIIADEPTTALDVTVQAEVLDVIRGLQDRLGMGVLLVTHNFGVVADVCDRVAVMQTGRIVEQGPVRTILREPAHPYTRMLLSSTLEGKTPMTPLLAAIGQEDR